jgi:import inner membrane translocase subunit TIM44
MSAPRQVLLFRNAKTREVIVGREDRVEQCMYAAVITRVEEEIDDEITGGWKVVEVSRHASAPLSRVLIPRQMARRSARAYL